MTQAIFSITLSAAVFINEKLVERGTPGSAIRVGVRGGMCEGYSYHVEFDDDPPYPTDSIFEKESTKVFIDAKSLVFLSGGILDYEKTLMKYGLVIRNPNEASRCGCGISFTIK